MVDVIGRAKVIVESAIDQSSLDRTGSKIGAGLKKGAVIGVAAFGTLAVAGVKAYQAFEEAEAQSRKLANVLGNMGEAGSVAGVEKLADQLMRVTGIDDEVIKGGQTILATFSQVASSAGDVGGTFERATKAAVDMSATGFGSVQSASVMLGKALQDPVKGVTALGRAGVTFSEEQKQMIASLVETGDVAAAQNLILKEVEKQVGGTAEATATESAKISAAMGEIQESVGLALSELTGGEITSFSESLLAMSDAITDLAESEGWEATGEALRDLNSDVKDNDTFLGQWAEGNRESAKSLLELLGTVTDSVPAFRDAFSDHESLWSQWGSKIGGIVKNVIGDIKDYIKWQSSIGEESPGFRDSGEGSGFFNSAPGRRAVGGPASGLTVVGESGPELLDLPNGSYVHSNINSERIVAGGGNTYVYSPQLFGYVSGSALLSQYDWESRFAARLGPVTA